MELDLLLFRVENYLCAIRITDAPYCFRAVELMPLPSPSEYFQGLVDFHGTLVPVYNIRKKFKLPECPLHPSHSMLKLQHGENSFIMVVDDVTGFFKRAESAIAPLQNQATSVLPVTGVFQMEGKPVYLLEVEDLLSGEEQIDLSTVTILLHPDTLPGPHAN